MKRILCVVLMLVLFTGLIQINVSAADTTVTTVDELVDALSNGGTVVLGADLEIRGYVEIGNDVVLDLNGHVISAAPEEYTVALLSRNGCNVVIRDSVGGGGLFDSDGIVYLMQEHHGTLTLESGRFQRVDNTGGTLDLVGGSMDTVYFGSADYPVTVTKRDAATVTEWVCFEGTVNFDPTEYLWLGYAATNNGDGTYTVDSVTVPKTGKTITVYFDNYLEDVDKYHISRDGSAPEQLFAEVLFVNDGANESIEMTRIDEEGRYWKAEIDTAYLGGNMSFAYPDAGVSTPIIPVPHDSGLTYSSERGWNLEANPDNVDEFNSGSTPTSDTASTPTETTISDTTSTPRSESGSDSVVLWVVLIALGVVVIAVVVILMVRKKKPDDTPADEN